jgi:hypothetical protein
MSLVSENKITIRLFAGCLAGADLKLLLDNSPSWKEEQIIEGDSTQSLTLLRYEKRDYLGWLLDSSEVSIAEVEEFEKELRVKVAEFCPSYDLSKVKIVIFPQIFVS